MSKVLFQSTIPLLFRSTLIGYLYEIAQKHRVVLLTEELDSDTQKILRDKSLFPKLENIIFFDPPFHGNIFRKNKQLQTIIRKTVKEYKPDVVIAPSDMWPSGMYLMRFAKKVGATTVAIQPGLKIAEKKRLLRWSYFQNAHEKMPRFLPFFLRIALIKLKKHLGHFFYYWILPITVGEMPFLGKTSFVFWDESSGLRDADYAAVFSKRDYDICIKEGVAREKLVILGHPLEHKNTRKFFEKVYFSENKGKANSKIATIMWSGEKIGLKDGNHSFISKEEMQKNRARIVRLITKKLPDYKIFIKPYPYLGAESAAEIKEFLAPIPQNLFVVDATEPADKYIEMSSVIVGIPPASTTLFTASKQNSEKIILSLNLDNELLGVTYKNFNGIDYIDNEENLVRVLHSIQNNTYKKKASTVSEFDFSDAEKLIQHVYEKRIS